VWLLERRDRPETFLAVDRPPADQLVALRPEVAEAAMVWLPEAAQRGLDGFAADWLAVRLPWGFDPTEVAVEVDLWYGAQDPDVPPRHGEFLATRLPRPRLTIWPDQGHWGMFSRWGEIVTALVGS
jgi:pimeloyl-ACP methyl ester carboxylesterase